MILKFDPPVLLNQLGNIFPHRSSKNFVLAFLKYMDGSELVSLKCITIPFRPTSGFPFNLTPLDSHSRGIPVYHSYYARKAPNCPI